MSRTWPARYSSSWTEAAPAAPPSWPATSAAGTCPAPASSPWPATTSRAWPPSKTATSSAPPSGPSADPQQLQRGDRPDLQSPASLSLTSTNTIPIIGEDPGLWVSLGVHSAQIAPRSPNPPAYSPGPACYGAHLSQQPQASPCRKSWRMPARNSAALEQPQRAFLLEVQGSAGRGGDAAQPPPQVGHRGSHRRLGQHAHAERERGRTDVVAPLQFERRRHGLQILLGKHAVRRPASRNRSPRPRNRSPRPRNRSPRPRNRPAPGNRPPPRNPSPAPRTGRTLPDPGEQPEVLAVAEHASRRAEPPGGLRDAHEWVF